MADGAQSFPPLVVGTDVAAVKRMHRFPIALAIGLIVFSSVVGAGVAALVASTGGAVMGLLSAAPFLVVNLFAIFLTVMLVHTVGIRSVSGTILILNGGAMEWRLPQGVLVVPWGAIGSVSIRKRGRHRILTYRLADGVTAEALGIRSEVSPAVYRRVSSRGLQLGSAGIDVPIDTVLAATAAFTQGRLAPR